MARLRINFKGKTFTWTSPVGSVRKGCVVTKNLHNDFAYRIKDSDGRVWIAYPSELTEEV
jgi:hypothetical protein